MVGITPARAGKSVTVHASHVTYNGSPPRVRGKDKVAGNHGVGSGITPARAGKRTKTGSYTP